MFETSYIISILPELFLSLWGVLIVVVDLFRKKATGSGLIAHLTIVGLLITILIGALFLLTSQYSTGFWGSVVVDRFSVSIEIIFLIIAIFSSMLALPYLALKRFHKDEVYCLLIFSTVGMMLMLSATDMLLMFIGLEILSISSYIMCGMFQTDAKSSESALKYFLPGAVGSAILLYGIVFVYGHTSSLSLYATVSPSEQSWMWSAGLVMLLAGFSFKVALVPFHMWTPDVYEGAPTSIVAFLSTAPKAAGFAALVRILHGPLGSLDLEWQPVLWILAILSMTLGNLAALRQSNIKRMMAYSSIAHAGYIALAIVAGDAEGLAAFMFYTLIYSITTFGVFACIVLTSRNTGTENLSFDDYRGLGYKMPFVSIGMFIFMLTLAGIPLTAGFIGKFQIFRALIESDLLWLALIGIVNSVISVFYYLRVVVALYMQPKESPSEATVAIPFQYGLYLVVGLCVIISIVAGLFPDALFTYSFRAVSLLIAAY